MLIFPVFKANNILRWVFSTLLPSSETSNHNVYDSSKSSTYKGQSGSTWDISYADGSGASGVCGTDDVVVGSTKVTGQVIELANKVSSSFVSGAGDGLLGLAFSSINTGISYALPANNEWFD